MGIIQRQAIKGTILTYTGTIVGFATSAILFPRVLTTAEIGLLGVLISYSLIFAQFGSLGFASATTRLFPYFRTEDKKHKGFLFIALMVSLVGFLLMLVLYFVLKPILMEGKAEESPMLAEYFYLIIPLIFFTILFNTLDHYTKVLLNAVRGIFIKEFLLRVLVLAAIVAFFFMAFSFEYFVYSYIIIFCIPAVLMIFTLIREGQFNLRPDFSHLDSNMKKTMASMSMFGIILSATGIITLNIDRIMIEQMIGLDATGIYTTTFFFGTMIIMPSRSLVKISSPVIADAWKENDMGKISMIYHKSSLHQLIIGALFLVGIWGNIDTVFIILTDKFIDGKYVILFIGLAYLSDMSAGTAGAILGTSKKYRVQALMMVIMVVLIIISNYIFIPVWGIAGAAFASFSSKFVFNLMRYLYIWYRFKMQPFNYKILLVVVYAIVSYLAVVFIPFMNHFIIDLIIRSAIISIVFLGLIISTNISEEINTALLKYKKKFLG
jgi:O-antigen/teichoic acid export membrane protein